MKKDINWLGALAALVLLFPVVLWCGYVYSTLWGWFLVPSLGVPHLGTVPAAGLAMLIQFMHPTMTPIDSDTDTPVWVKFLGRALGGLFVLGFGAIINLWM